MLCNCFSVSMNDVRAFWKNLLHYSVFSKITGLLVDLWVVCFVFVVLSVGEKKVNLLEKSCLCQRRSTCSIIMFCHWSWPQPEHGALRQELGILFFSMLFPDLFSHAVAVSQKRQEGVTPRNEFWSLQSRVFDVVLQKLQSLLWLCQAVSGVTAHEPKHQQTYLGIVSKAGKKLWKHKNWGRLGMLTLSKLMPMDIKASPVVPGDVPAPLPVLFPLLVGCWPQMMDQGIQILLLGAWI